MGLVVNMAHAAGFDEILLIWLPVLVFIAVYRVVRGPLRAVPDTSSKRAAKK